MFGNQGWANNRLGISPISPQTSPQKLSFHSEEEEKLKPLPAGFVCDAGVLTTMTEEPGKRGEDYYIHRIYLTGGYSYTTTVDSKFVDDDGDDSCAGRNIGGSRTFEERRDYMNDVVFSPTSGSCPSSKAQYYELKNVGSCGCPDEEADNYDVDADWANPIQCEYSCDDSNRVVDDAGRCTSECKEGFKFDETEGKCVELTAVDEVKAELGELPLGKIALGVGVLVALKVGTAFMSR